MNSITIYTRPDCDLCAAAKALLKRKDLGFHEITIAGARGSAIALWQRDVDRTVPQIYIGTYHVGGFDDLEALDTSGRLDKLLDPQAVL
ncbi:glutaredoxin domain-containing protein [Paraburkholderia rhizosphaerae]|uniref:Glutaredoxin 3 n=1 Tax=Paraburkholderia rhizosphaerae TaxID=480658 RepID=A0A4R8LWK4_9BURK|nr:glutaredoxin domain-containing protein [Paraburkholderia rhizosphaerae]TDY52304.1 glutaredoxin 3 [Paraburkholderia rhizosphaerae]